MLDSKSRSDLRTLWVHELHQTQDVSHNMPRLVSICRMCDVSVGRLKTEEWLTKIHYKPGLLCQVWYSQSSSLMDIWKNKPRDLVALERKQCTRKRTVPGHCTLRWHLYVTGLSEIATCRKCGQEGEPSYHRLCQCPAIAAALHGWSLTQTNSGPRTEDRALSKSHSEDSGVQHNQLSGGLRTWGDQRLSPIVST